MNKTIRGKVGWNIYEKCLKQLFYRITQQSVALFCFMAGERDIERDNCNDWQEEWNLQMPFFVGEEQDKPDTVWLYGR